MEGGDGGNFHDSDSEPGAAAAGVGAGQKTKRGKSVGEGGAQRKMLGDITNLQQQQKQQQQQQQWCAKPINQQEKQHSAPLLEADISIDQLLKENAMLMKLLANRNAIIESCKTELEKSQSNFHKLRKQNSELALTNSQMLAELNSSRQRVRELQHELGGKNGILIAMKLELAEKEHRAKLMQEGDANEVGASQSKQADQSFQEDNKGGNLCHAKRKRVSKSQSSAPAVVKQVKSTVKVDKRYSLRRESAGSKAEKPGPTEDNFEVDEIKYDVLHLQENLANENEQTSSGSKVHEDAREDAPSSGPTNTEQVQGKKNIENIEKKRESVRRQSTRFRLENPEPTADFFEIDDTKLGVSHLCDNMSEKSDPITSSVTSGQENNACTLDPREHRRSSVGRPLRRTVEKVVSYREVPLNVKMRRPN